jgi:integrase
VVGGLAREKQRTLSPNGYNAAASPVRRWIVPTIGHRRLDALTPADLRAVADAQRDAGRKGATAAATHRTLLNMLRAAIVEGHQVPQRVLLVPAPKADESDRMDLSVPESVACLRVAADLPNGIRWALALLYGARQGEVLGLTEEYVDFDAHEIRLEWQLDALPYNVAARPVLGLPGPDGYEARHLVDAWHLVRPKTKKGFRVLPMTPAIEDRHARLARGPAGQPVGAGLPRGRRAAAQRQGRPHRVVGDPGRRVDGVVRRPAELGPVQVGHPAGRYYHIHECRNVTATQLGEAGVDPVVIQSLLGHATAAMSAEYRRIHRAPKLEAVEKVAELLPFADPAVDDQLLAQRLVSRVRSADDVLGLVRDGAAPLGLVEVGCHQHELRGVDGEAPATLREVVGPDQLPVAVGAEHPPGVVPVVAWVPENGQGVHDGRT